MFESSSSVKHLAEGPLSSSSSSVVFGGAFTVSTASPIIDLQWVDRLGDAKLRQKLHNAQKSYEVFFLLFYFIKKI
jgi:hypothetical protein